MRSLPENTVDAWTAIHLAATGAQWIWLPTTNQGASTGGSHPGDVSMIANRRLVIFENKAVEDGREIPFGSNAQQRQMLRAVEDVGLSLVSSPSDRPCLGWVFYGLPLTRPGSPPNGLDWPRFPWFQHLMCPHHLDSIGVPATGNSAISKLETHWHRAIDHCEQARRPPFPYWPLLLGNYRPLLDMGLIGLPIDAQDPLGFLQGLADAVGRAVTESGLELPQGRLDTPDPENWRGLIDHVVGVLTTGADHVMGGLA